jgi:lantibiotic biosynthesis protein
VDAFVGALKGEKVARLIELDLAADGACRGPDGTYANELVVPFLHGTAKEPAPAHAPQPARPEPALRRTFAPGSEWCLAKIYCPSGAVDAVLRECVAPLVAAATTSGAADSWFFTRDADPDVHLRLHLHGVPARLYGEVLPQLEGVLQPLLASGRARRFVIAPYERALEKDGGDHAVPILERIHRADSDAAVTLLALLEDVPEGKERWAFALLGMHRLMDDFDYVLDARRRVIEAGQRQLKSDLTLTLEQERAIADRYRQERPFFATWLEGRGVPEAVEAAFAVRSAALRPHAKALAARKAEGKLVGRFDTQVSSLMNAWVRRMMRARPSQHSAVLHAFLAKHYESIAARSKKPAPRA